MSFINTLLKIWPILFLGLIFSSCAENSAEEEFASINIRISSDPDRLNPLLTVSPVSRLINSLLFLTSADFDPNNFELSPVLIKGINEGVAITEGKYKGGRRFDLEFRSEANWD